MAVDGLSVARGGADARSPLIHNVSFDVHRGETVCLVGESGSGKTLTALALMSLLPAGLQAVAGQCLFDDRDVLQLPFRQRQRIYGRDIAMIFQDPMSSLNPVLTVGEQIDESLARHQPGWTQRQRQSRAEDVLVMTGIREPRACLRRYPHELSGGLCQRILIAIALANQPRLIIADEPTTALDVTVQAQVMTTLRAACEQMGAALILITHDMGLVGQYADRVMVMYAGRIVEQGTTAAVFQQPRHPYSRALLDSIPRLTDDPNRELTVIPGEPSISSALLPGCAFAPRCPRCRGRQICRTESPSLTLETEATLHWSACHFSEEASAKPPAVAL
nr:ABC transporter ATP-binding protein [Brenneria tiliae]